MPRHILDIAPVITPSVLCSSDSPEEDNGHKWKGDAADNELGVNHCDKEGACPQRIKKYKIWVLDYKD